MRDSNFQYFNFKCAFSIKLVQFSYNNTLYLRDFEDSRSDFEVQSILNDNNTLSQYDIYMMEIYARISETAFFSSVTVWISGVILT